MIKLQTKVLNLLKNFKSSFEVFSIQFPIKNDRENLIKSDLNNLWLFIKKQITNKGNLHTIKMIKHFRLSVYKYTAGETVPCSAFLRTYKSGLPKAFGPRLSKSIEAGNADTIRSLLTLLQISYLLEGYGQPKYDSINDPYTGTSEALSDVGNWFESNYQKYFKVKPKTFWDSPHHTSKMGPIGPALTHCIYELDLLTDEHLIALKEMGGPRFTMWLENCYVERKVLVQHQEIRLLTKGVDVKRDKTLRRLVLLKHPEGKLRPIAILDFWSQTVLKTLHEWAFAQLAELRTDMTFNQGNVVKHFSGNDGPFFSFDLKSATDRFPIKLQERFLNKILGEKRVAAWKFLMVGLPFNVEFNKVKTKVEYNTGQCMGAYSSWGIFSLCHHLLVQYCAEKVGESQPFMQYAILGDDIVIAKERVALEYMKVIQSLGMEIDLTKSLVSKDTFEFAKRIIHTKKGELTAFPLSAMIENRKSPRALWSTSLTARERGYVIGSDRIPSFVVDIQRACGGTFRSTIKHVRILEGFWLLKEITSTQDDRLAWCLSTLFDAYNVRTSCSTNLWHHRTMFLERLGEYLMEFQSIQLDSLYRESLTTTFRLGATTILNTDGTIDGPATQVRPDIDISRIPLVWVGKLLANRGQHEMNKLRQDAERGNWSAFLQSYPPTGNLAKVISRQVNLNKMAINSAKMKHIVQRFKRDNDLMIRELTDI